MIQISTESENQTVTMDGEPVEILEELLFGVKQFLLAIAKQSRPMALQMQQLIIAGIHHISLNPDTTENE